METFQGRAGFISSNSPTRRVKLLCQEMWGTLLVTASHAAASDCHAATCLALLILGYGCLGAVHPQNPSVSPAAPTGRGSTSPIACSAPGTSRCVLG